MALLRTFLLTTALGACATARMEPGGDDQQAQPDAATPLVDAPRRVDAPSMAGCAQAFTGVLATWDFAAETGSQASTAVKTTATGVVAGPIERATALTAVSGANSINSSSWPTAAQPDPAKHYKLTIAPPTGCALQITSLAIDARASATGPMMAAVTTSLDSYGQPIAIAPNAVSSPAMSMSAQSTMVELHVSGFAASATAGTMRLQGAFTISGSLL